MTKIQELSILEKPREKAERFGIDKLTDIGLLALVINVGTVGHSSLEIAEEILKEAGSLDILVSKPYEYYLSFKGLNKVNALKLKSMFEIIKRINEKRHLQNESIMEVNSESLFRRYSLSLSGLTQENLVLIILNKNKQIIFESTLFKGDDALSVVSTREILRES